jgi:hypothetical protein
VPPIKLEPRPYVRIAEVERVSITTVQIWLHEGQLLCHMSLLRNEARAIGEALIREANRPFEHHQREESDG